MLTPQSALRLLRDPTDFGLQLHHQYGDIVKLPVPRFNVVSVAGPALVKEVFTTPDTRSHTGEAMRETVGPLVGPGSILVHDEKPHIEQRKRLLPMFGGENLRRHGDLIHELTLREMETWPVGEPFSLLHHTDRMALGAILALVFGSYDERRVERVQALSERVARQIYVALLPGMLRRDLGRFSPWGRFLQARQALDKFIREEIELRRNEAGSEERNDILAMLMSIRRDDGAAMSDADLRDELVTLILTGEETTATAMAWAMERLLRTPRVLAKLRDSIAAGEDDYLNATVKEVLRARPVVTPFPRKLVSETEIAGYTLPAGTYVLIASFVMHQRPDLFPDPEKFRPERYLEEKAENYSWVAFGGGVRRCLGGALAEYEMRIFLRAIVEYADLSLPDPKPEGMKLRSTIVPKNGAQVILDRPLRSAPTDSMAAATF